MPQGDKSSYTDKQKCQAAHIEAGYEQAGLSPQTAAGRAWATVNKLTGGGRKSGTGRRHASQACGRRAHGKRLFPASRGKDAFAKGSSPNPDSSTTPKHVEACSPKRQAILENDYEYQTGRNRSSNFKTAR